MPVISKSLDNYFSNHYYYLITTSTINSRYSFKNIKISSGLFTFAFSKYAGIVCNCDMPD